MTRQRTLEQRRAERAWAAVNEAKERGDKAAKEYGSLARNAPADLQANGLGQTLAFLRAKGFENGKKKDNGYSLLFGHISSWVMAQLGAEGTDLLLWVTNTASSQDYRRATTEAIAFSSWLKRFAEAELPTGADHER
jgi:CRISPR-associated protein Cmr5